MLAPSLWVSMIALTSAGVDARMPMPSSTAYEGLKALAPNPANAGEAQEVITTPRYVVVVTRAALNGDDPKLETAAPSASARILAKNAFMLRASSVPRRMAPAGMPSLPSSTSRPASPVRCGRTPPGPVRPAMSVLDFMAAWLPDWSSAAWIVLFRPVMARNPSLALGIHLTRTSAFPAWAKASRAGGGDDQDVIDKAVGEGLLRFVRRRRDRNGEAVIGLVLPLELLAPGARAHLRQHRLRFRVITGDGVKGRRAVLGLDQVQLRAEGDLRSQPGLDIAAKRKSRVLQGQVELVGDGLVRLVIGEAVHRAEQVDLLRNGRIEVGHGDHVRARGHHFLDRGGLLGENQDRRRADSTEGKDRAGRNQQAPVAEKPGLRRRRGGGGGRRYRLPGIGLRSRCQVAFDTHPGEASQHQLPPFGQLVSCAWSLPGRCRNATWRGPASRRERTPCCGRPGTGARPRGGSPPPGRRLCAPGRRPSGRASC